MISCSSPRWSPSGSLNVAKERYMARSAAGFVNAATRAVWLELSAGRRWVKHFTHINPKRGELRTRRPRCLVSSFHSSLGMPLSL